MFEKEMSAVAAAARAKSVFLAENRGGYWISTLMSGFHIGFASLLILTVGGYLAGFGGAKIAMGAAFALALSLVIIAGSELFTGNNMFMTAGMLCGTASITDTAKVWTVCLIGNWAGSVIIAVMYWGCQLPVGPVGELAASVAAAKMNVPPLALFLRGILCNMLVCLGIWCSFRCTSDSAKLIMVFWVIFAFVTTGFEHSIANMSLLTVGMLVPHGPEVTLGGYFYNILMVVLGNVVGGVLFVGTPYFMMSRHKLGKTAQ